MPGQAPFRLEPSLLSKYYPQEKAVVKMETKFPTFQYTAIVDSEKAEEGFQVNDEPYSDEDAKTHDRPATFIHDATRCSEDRIRLSTSSDAMGIQSCHNSLMPTSIRQYTEALYSYLKDNLYRRFFVGATLFVVCFLFFFARVDLSSSRSKEPLRIILRESGGWHDEVTASFMESLQSYNDVQTHIFLKAERFGMEKIYEQFKWEREPLVNTHENFTAYNIKDFAPHAIISVTCANDLEWYSNVYETILKETNTILMCVVHHPEFFYAPNAKHNLLTDDWRKNGRIRFITLASHVTEALNGHFEATRVNQMDSIGTWETYTYPPVFSVDEAPKETRVRSNQRPTFVLQGNIESQRRDYNHTFATFDKEVSSLEVGTKDSPQLLVLGSGSGSNMLLTESMKDKIVFKTNLPYHDFYRTLHDATGIIPAFATDGYYFDKASSTVAASLISTTPLIASPLLLEKYKYLDKSVVYLRRKDENAVQAALRLYKESPLARSRLAAAVWRKRRSVIQSNRSALKSWLQNSARSVNASHR
jgi:hypothetical protein